MPFALLLSTLSSHCYPHLSGSSVGFWVLPDSWFCPYPFPLHSWQDPLWVQTSLSSLSPLGHLGASSSSWSCQVLCLPAPCPPPARPELVLQYPSPEPHSPERGVAAPCACLSPYHGEPKEEALTIRVDAHSRGRDVCGDGEVRDPQVLRGDGRAQKGLPPPPPALDPAGLEARGDEGGPCLGGTSICRSLKTLQTLLLKPAPENMDVIG